MLSRADARKKSSENSGSRKFLSDLETINKALNMDKTLSRLASSTASSRSKSVGKLHLPEPKIKPKETKSDTKDSSDKDKKSIWSWKGLKALTQVKNRRFNCRFSITVHSIEGLPSFFNDISLVVHWKRRDSESMTRPFSVHQGVAESEEELTHCCSVYGSRSGPHHSAKYEAKHFLLYASVYNAPDLDLGKHRVDLTRLLPLTLEELEEEKSSGKWTTSYRLSGKAKGAVLNVSFGYVVIGNSGIESSKGEIDRREEFNIRRTGSLPARSSISNRSAEDIKDLHEVLPVSKSELSDSVDILYQKLDEDMASASVEKKSYDDSSHLPPPDSGENISGTECEFSGFSVVDKGIEELTKEQFKLEYEETVSQKDEPINLNENHEDDSCTKEPLMKELEQAKSEAEETVYQVDEPINSNDNHEDDSCTKESLMKELETALSCASNLMNEGSDSEEDEIDALLQDNYSDDDSIDRRKEESNSLDRGKGKSLSLDDSIELVADEFLHMLGIEHSPFGPSSESEPDSPRERLLRRFEKETLANGGLLSFEIDDDSIQHVNDFPFEIPEIEETDAFMGQKGASRLEDLENEALMREFGLNEKAFQKSPPVSSGGFGSPIHVPIDDPNLLPPLSEGVGPFVQTKNGGFLSSMNPSLFKKGKTGGGGRLIMQVSSPVVVPAEMGSGVMNILQGLASVGIEKLSMQANKLMPLEDVTGKTMQQIAWEAGAPALEGHDYEREVLFQNESDISQNISTEQMGVKGRKSSRLRPSDFNSNSDTEYVSLDDLAPLAMDKIEALSLEGLRIQSGMSDTDAPSDISTQSEFSALKGKSVNLDGSIGGLDGTGGLQLMDIKHDNNSEDVDGLMGLSLTLDEWMRLDSGEIDDEDLTSERTSKILAAHHATSLDHFRGKTKGRGKSKKYGLLGNNFTVGLMVQLRDPLRNYEPVGAPMLALVQVERVFVPTKPKIYSNISFMTNSFEEEKEELVLEKPKEDKKEDTKIEDQELTPQYKITEVHVAGLKTEPGKKKLWGSTNQQQAGSRWLLANGMGKKNNKHPLMKSKTVNAKSSSGTGAGLGSVNTTTVQPGETLWSISSRVHGTGAKWKEIAALNPQIRNPNIILPNETIRLR